MNTVPSEVVSAAQAAQKKWKIPTSVQIAQWALESGWGEHQPGFNCFGIKALPGHDTQTFATHEVVHGHLIACTQTFARFTDLAEAFECHAALIATAPVYAAAMRTLPSLQQFVSGMAPHYATDPQYGAKIMAVIKGSNLTQYDK